ncbi:hypothetical protein pEaSNUABM19_00004 [Erwinia phage pEa_SNUABM_19]|nr:hypothetical protein pEaSNUABM19_00004 [Erwinia phage pEa_SNUABM_19]
MRLSKLLAELSKVAELAKVHGNNDPDISFWHDEIETIEHLEVSFPQDLDDARIIFTKMGLTASPKKCNNTYKPEKWRNPQGAEIRP